MYKLRIQMVLYKNSVGQLRRAIESLIISSQVISRDFQLLLGSNSCNKVINQGYIKLVRNFAREIDIKLHISEENIGHGAMHNLLFSKYQDESELLLIINPDGIIGPSSLAKMINRVTTGNIGAVEPRQLPFDHPKIFELGTGETTWLSGACILMRADVFRDIGGFDERFFLHCDDVDLSWRIRNEGFKLIHATEAIYFHDKLVAENGHPELSESESFYGPLGALLLAHKYSLNRALTLMIKDLSLSKDPQHEEILQIFKWRSKTLPSLRIQRQIPQYIHPWKFSETRY